jgi:hypothetical protein
MCTGPGRTQAGDRDSSPVGLAVARSDSESPGRYCQPESESTVTASPTGLRVGPGGPGLALAAAVTVARSDAEALGRLPET